MHPDIPNHRKSPFQRKTKQVSAVTEILDQAAGPLTPEQILAQAKLRVPSLGLSTIYRILSKLESEGKVAALTIPGSKPHYEKSPRPPHDHFICGKCRKVFKIDQTRKHPPGPLPEGYSVDCHEIFYFGTCLECR